MIFGARTCPVWGRSVRWNVEQQPWASPSTQQQHPVLGWVNPKYLPTLSDVSGDTELRMAVLELAETKAQKAWTRALVHLLIGANVYLSQCAKKLRSKHTDPGKKESSFLGCKLSINLPSNLYSETRIFHAFHESKYLFLSLQRIPHIENLSLIGKSKNESSSVCIRKGTVRNLQYTDLMGIYSGHEEY